MVSQFTSGYFLPLQQLAELLASVSLLSTALSATVHTQVSGAYSFMFMLGFSIECCWTITHLVATLPPQPLPTTGYTMGFRVPSPLRGMSRCLFIFNETQALLVEISS